MRIISNSAMSLDGKLSTRMRDAFRMGSSADLEMMQNLRDQADAILVGGQTFRHWSELMKGSGNHEPLNVVYTNSFQFDSLDWNHKNRLFVTSGKAPEKFKHCTVEDCDTPQKIIEALSKRGIKTLLIEAGGALIFQFAEANLLHELYVTITPCLIGGVESPTLVDGLGFSLAQIKKLTLLNSRVVGDEIFLHYKVLA